MQRSDSFPDVKQMEVVEFISSRREDWKEKRFKEWNSCQIVSQTIFSPLFFSLSLTKRVRSLPRSLAWSQCWIVFAEKFLHSNLALIQSPSPLPVKDGRRREHWPRSRGFSAVLSTEVNGNSLDLSGWPLSPYLSLPPHISFRCYSRLSLSLSPAFILTQSNSQHHHRNEPL